MQWCGACDVEVPPGNELCPHCGGRTSDPPFLTSAPPENVELVNVVSDSPSRVRQVSNLLRSAGIEHWVRYEPNAPTQLKGNFGREILVKIGTRREDAERAARIRDEELLASLPDIPPDFAEVPLPSEACPACGSRLAPDATECGDCGLAIFDGDLR